MKKTKTFLFVALLVPCMMLFSACSGQKADIVSITKTQETATSETYAIVYSDGRVNNLELTKDDNSDSGKDIYELAVKYGYTGTFWDFLSEYLHYDAESKTTNAVSEALTSTVSVVAGFTGTTVGYKMTIYGYEPYTYEQAFTSAGSGVIYSLDKENGNAYIITNYHVVYSTSSNTTDKISDDISIGLYGMENEESAIKVDYVGGSMNYDIAVLKVTDSDILKSSICTACEVADSNEIVVGETAIAVGNPEAEGISATSGVVSVDSEYITMKASDNKTIITSRVIRIDTAINGGNSGGGLFNDEGKLIGIVNAKVVKENIDNISYAIPVNVASRVADNILDNSGSVSLFNLGANFTGVNSRAVYDEKLLSIKINEDVSVKSVTENSIASKIGLQENDIIKSITINSKNISFVRAFELVDELLTIRSGDTIAFNILRDNEEVTKGYSVSSDDFALVA